MNKLTIYLAIFLSICILACGKEDEPKPPTPQKPDEPTRVEVTALTLSKTSITLNVGGSETLTATVTPDNATDKKVNWTSSNTSVAKVVNGVVTAVAPGEATITATAGGKSATCKVTITSKSGVNAGIDDWDSGEEINGTVD